MTSGRRISTDFVPDYAASLAAALPDALVLFDHSAQVVYANAAAHNTFAPVIGALPDNWPQGINVAAFVERFASFVPDVATLRRNIASLSPMMAAKLGMGDAVYCHCPTRRFHFWLAVAGERPCHAGTGDRCGSFWGGFAGRA